MNPKYIFWACLVTALMGCDNGMLSPIELVKYTENPANGLRVSKKSKDFQMEAQYKPLDYIVAMEEQKTSLKKEVVENRKQELGNEMDYFNFRISPATQGKDIWSYLKGGNEREVHGDVAFYLSYEAKKDFFLLDGPDTVDCQLFQYVNTSSLSPHLDFVLGFEKRPTSDRVLVYNDRILETGPVAFRIEKENINNIPAIKTK